MMSRHFMMYDIRMCSLQEKFYYIESTRKKLYEVGETVITKVLKER